MGLASDLHSWITALSEQRLKKVNSRMSIIDLNLKENLFESIQMVIMKGKGKCLIEEKNCDSLSDSVIVNQSNPLKWSSIIELIIFLCH